MSSMIIIQITLFCIYLIKKLEQLKYFMLKFKYNEDLNPYTDNNNNYNLKKKYIKNNLNKKRKIRLKTKKMNKDNIYKNKRKNNSSLNQISKNEFVKAIMNSPNQSEQKNITFNQNNYIQTINMDNPVNSKISNIFQNKLLNLNIQELDYEEAIIYDQRSYIKIYWGFLNDSQIILDTFFNKTNLDLFVIKLSFLVFTFQINFFLNAFFYTDEYISDAYHNNGVLDFISGLPKSIYSFIAALLITNLLKMLSDSKSELIKVIRNKSKFNDYLNIINKELSKLSKKLIVYFILVFLFELFFLYYITIFCAVYRFSQKYWFLGCLESFGIDLLSAFIICIFLALLRYISIKRKIKCLYIFTNIINTFL